MLSTLKGRFSSTRAYNAYAIGASGRDCGKTEVWLMYSQCLSRKTIGTMTCCVRLQACMIAITVLSMVGVPGVGGQEGVRSFSMGVAYWPPLGVWTPDDVVRDDLGKLLPSTDAILVQVPWCPGSDLSEAAWMSSIAIESGKQLILAIDWLAGGRREVRCSEANPWTFAAEETTVGFRDAIIRLAERFRPHYMLLGVEVDHYAVIAPTDFPHFLAAYQIARAEVGGVSPETRVGVSLQYEHMMRTPGERDLFVNEMVTTFEGMSDFVGLSTYPFMGGVDDPGLDATYFAAVEDLAIPLAIMETGWPAANVVGSQYGYGSQAPYLASLLRALDALEVSMVVWASVRDVDLGHVDDGTPPWAAFIGLWDSGGNPKPALAVWLSWLTRQPAVGNFSPL